MVLLNIKKWYFLLFYCILLSSKPNVYNLIRDSEMNILYVSY